MTILIEILGSPGSGKTTLANELNIFLNKKGLPAYHSNNIKKYKSTDNNYNFIKKFYLFINTSIFFFFYFIKFYKIYFIKKKISNNFFFRMLKLHFIHTYNINYLKKKFHKNEIIIMEPGPIMSFLHDYFYSTFLVDKKLITKFDNSYKFDLIICLSCDNQLAYERINKRESGPPLRMQNMNKLEMIEIIESSKRNINEFLLTSDTKVININTKNLQPFEITNKIYTKLLSLNIIS